MLTYIIIGAVVLVGVLLYVRNKGEKKTAAHEEAIRVLDEKITRTPTEGEATFPELAGPNVNVPDIQPIGAATMAAEKLLVNGVELTPSNPYFKVKAGQPVTITYQGQPLPPEVEAKARASIRTDNKPSPKAGTAEIALKVRKATGRQPDGTILPGLPSNVPSQGSEYLTLSISQGNLSPRRAFAIQEQAPALFKVSALPWEADDATLKFTPVAKFVAKQYPAYIEVYFQPALSDVAGEGQLTGRIFVE